MGACKCMNQKPKVFYQKSQLRDKTKFLQVPVAGWMLPKITGGSKPEKEIKNPPFLTCFPLKCLALAILDVVTCDELDADDDTPL